MHIWLWYKYSIKYYSNT